MRFPKRLCARLADKPASARSVSLSATTVGERAGLFDQVLLHEGGGKVELCLSRSNFPELAQPFLPAPFDARTAENPWSQARTSAGENSPFPGEEGRDEGEPRLGAAANPKTHPNLRPTQIVSKCK